MRPLYNALLASAVVLAGSVALDRLNAPWVATPILAGLVVLAVGVLPDNLGANE